MRQAEGGDSLVFMKRLVWITALAILVPSRAAPQGYDPSLFAGLRWRLIGPFRGGRTVAAMGVPGQPNLFYIGVNNGGVWKTTDYGRVWTPMFDAESTGSIGAIAVAPSDPRTLYVGSGEGLQRPDLSVGDGIYKSTDGGETWQKVLYRDENTGGMDLAFAPADPQTVFAVLWSARQAPWEAGWVLSKNNGLYKSSDGGTTWRQITTGLPSRPEDGEDR